MTASAWCGRGHETFRGAAMLAILDLMEQTPAAPDGGAKKPKVRGLYGQRPSKCHDEIRRRQFERIAALSPLERMIEALELGEEAGEGPTHDRDGEAPRRHTR